MKEDQEKSKPKHETDNEDTDASRNP